MSSTELPSNPSAAPLAEKGREIASDLRRDRRPGDAGDASSDHRGVSPS